MTDHLLRTRVLQILGEIAPDADLDALDPADSLREQLELDSLDVRRLVAELDAQLGVAVPEQDVPRMQTLDDVVDVVADLATGPGAA